MLSAIALHEKTGGGMFHREATFQRTKDDTRLFSLPSPGYLLQHLHPINHYRLVSSCHPGACSHLLNVELVSVTSSRIGTKKRAILGTWACLASAGCLVSVRAQSSRDARNSMLKSCLALAVSLTVHARQGHRVGLCNDFANAGSPCILAGVQLGMAYISSTFGESSIVPRKYNAQ